MVVTTENSHRIKICKMHHFPVLMNRVCSILDKPGIVKMKFVLIVTELIDMHCHW